MYITIDSGTTNTRIYTVNKRNVSLFAKSGIGANRSEELKMFLKENIAALTKYNIEAIIASGMITSGRGLFEIEHIEAPAGPFELHAAMKTKIFPEISSIPFTFIPGVKLSSDSMECADMMRGEETELMGLGEISADAAYVLPGSHSKCIITDDRGRIKSFFTMLTGEMIYALKKSTVIGDSFEYFDGVCNEYLSRGFEFAAGRGINEALFKCRIMDILYNKSKKEVYSFCLGAVLQGELSNIAKTEAKTFFFGGKRELRVPESFLFKKYFDKDAVCLDEDVCGNATALGAVKIYEHN